jgi:hypothetical protein
MIAVNCDDINKLPLLQSRPLHQTPGTRMIILYFALILYFIHLAPDGPDL